MFTSYTDVRDWLENFIPQTYTKKELGLERIRYFLKLLGNPQDKFKSIHIAGTSGKGSTAYYIAQLLRNCKIQFPNSKLQTNSNSKKNNSKNIWDLEFGAWNLKPKIGLHISPHLVYIGERMQINNTPIKVIELIKLISEIKPVVESMKNSPFGEPSYFEILVAASFLYFAQEKVDIAVVEVGLGGRLDATNVLKPEISVITNVGLDHMDILGKSIEKIAFEKAGIIKSATLVITGANGKALEIIKKVVKEKKAQLITKSTLIRAFGKKSDINKYRKLYKRLFDNSFPFVTEETFLLSCAVVASLGISLNEAKIIEAFKCPFAGRFEEIDENVIVDGAHNPDKLKVLVDFVRKFQISNFKFQIILVVAFKKDKEWRGMIDYLFRNLDIERCIATQFYSVTDMGPVPDGNRMGLYASVESEEIASYIISNFKCQMSNVKAISNSQEAVFGALRFAQGKLLKGRSDQKSLVLITGSLYLVGEVRTLWYLPKF